MKVQYYQAHAKKRDNAASPAAFPRQVSTGSKSFHYARVDFLPGPGSAFMSFYPPLRQLMYVTPGKQSMRAVVREFPHDRRSDADLVRDVILGHEEALVAVWRRHGPAVRRTLYAQLGSDDSVDDLLQEVFLAFTHGATRITQPDRLRSYLMAAAVRQARQAIRDRSRRRRWLGLLADDRRGASMPPAVHSRDALRRLRDILDHLPDRLRESFILRFVEGLPTVEVAEIRNVSLATAKRDVAKSHDRVLFQARRDPALTDYLRGPGAMFRDSSPPPSGADGDGETAARLDSEVPDSDAPSGPRESGQPEAPELEGDVWGDLDSASAFSGVDGARSGGARSGGARSGGARSGGARSGSGSDRPEPTGPRGGKGSGS